MFYKKVSSLLLSLTTLRFLAYFSSLFQDYFVSFWFYFNFDHLKLANDFFTWHNAVFGFLVESQRFESVAFLF